MTMDIVMIHGANEGAWSFDTFTEVFEGLGWTCHAPDLIGHGTKAVDGGKNLVGVGMANYRAELEALGHRFRSSGDHTVALRAPGPDGRLPRDMGRDGVDE